MNNEHTLLDAVLNDEKGQSFDELMMKAKYL